MSRRPSCCGPACSSTAACSAPSSVPSCGRSSPGSKRDRSLGIAGGQTGGYTGAVTYIQRFGGALNAHPHFHSLIPDGLFVERVEPASQRREAPPAPAAVGAEAPLEFVALPPPEPSDVEELTVRIAQRITRLVEKRTEEEAAGSRLTEIAASLEAALARAMRAPSTADARPFAERDHEGAERSLCARVAGFSLHAGRGIRAQDREGLERLCRYGLRAPFAQKRLRIGEDGQVRYELARPWPHAGGTSLLVLDPLDFLRRLAALLPGPYLNLVRYHGCFASRSKVRGRLPVPPERNESRACEPGSAEARPAKQDGPADSEDAETSSSDASPRRPARVAEICWLERSDDGWASEGADREVDLDEETASEGRERAPPVGLRVGVGTFHRCSQGSEIRSASEQRSGRSLLCVRAASGRVDRAAVGNPRLDRFVYSHWRLRRTQGNLRAVGFSSSLTSGGRRLRHEELERLRAMQLQPSDVLGWDYSPDSGMAVVRLAEQTAVFNRLRLPPTLYPFEATETAFSEDGARAAVATKNGEIVVIDKTGEVLHQVGVPGAFFSQLFLDPAGQTVTYTKETPHRENEIGVVVLSTEEIETLSDVPDGPRYYSADGLRMLVLDHRSPPGHAEYFDTSDPVAPVLISEYSTPSGIETASVCDDGSLVAIQQFEDGSGSLSRVLLLDGTLQVVGDPLVTAFGAAGLQFEGKFLFVGIQRHPFPAYLQGLSTTDILLFDLAG